MFVSQEGRTALMWAVMNGKAEVAKALIENGADLKAKEKVRSRYCVITGSRANDQGIFGTGLRDLGATGRECPMYCSCGLCAVFVTETTNDCAVFCAKCSTYSCATILLLVLQRVSIDNKFVIVTVRYSHTDHLGSKSEPLTRIIWRLCCLAAEMYGKYRYEIASLPRFRA
jgi:hypothetical protein